MKKQETVYWTGLKESMKELQLAMGFPASYIQK